MVLFGNRLLDAIAATAGGGFDPAAARSVCLQAGHVAQPGTSLKSLHFPQSALISTIVELGTGESADGVLIGSEGVYGAAATFGIKAPLFSSFVQRSGTGWVMPASELRRLTRENNEVAALLFRYEHFLLAQAQQSVACAIKHDIRARFCTILMRVKDDTGVVRLIQEDLARTLGVQRTSISLVAGGLQNDGAIRYQRGRIRIIDAGILRAGACECYQIVESFKRTLLEATPLPAVAASS